MSWKEVTASMSIAGDPEKIAAACEDAFHLLVSQLDATNVAEITNMQFGLRRMLAELKLTEKRQLDKERARNKK